MNKMLMNINPIAEFDRMTALMDRLLGSGMSLGPTESRGLVLPIDVYEKDSTLVFKAPVPGVKPEELDVQVENGVMTIRGEVRQDETLSDAKVYLRESTYGAFTRSVRLPEGLDFERIEARFQDGFVTITIPRIIEDKPKALKVEVKAG